MSDRRINELREQLGRCLARDREILAKRIRGVDRALKDGRDASHAIAQIARALESSVREREQRTKRVPKITYPADLPVSKRRDEIADAIRDNQVVVLCGETGSGKTTQLPKICLELGRGVDGLIGHTQPRRIAARSVAARIAEELRVGLGDTVGYKIRFGDKTSAKTLVKVMTDGVLLAETQHDRDLLAYDTIIIDEAHERGLNIDFLLGYLHRLLPKRPDLKLIITSATIDPERFSEHFGDAPIITVEGRTYPVELRERPIDPRDEATLYDAVVDAVAELPRDGGVLVFMPGEREIRQTAEALRKHHLPGNRGTELLPLYARLSNAEQQRVFAQHAGRRIVIATNVAETSITVPGIRYVVDPGVARLNRYSARTRVQRLEVEGISRASADQRAGRCGRVAPGICVRLYDDYAQRPEFTDPEIKRSNLASVILQMASLKLGDPERFPFVEAPDGRMIRDGHDTLAELGAIDERRRLTELGKRLARLPVDPRLGRMILAGDEEDCLREVLVIASAMSVQDPRERPHERRDEADELHAQHSDDKSDFVAWLNLWRFYHALKDKLGSAQLRKACRQNMLGYMRMREWVDVHRQLRELAKELGLRLNERDAEYPALHRALLAGLLSSVGRISDNREYTGASGGRFSIHPGSGLFGRSPKWVVAGELVRTTKLYARSVAEVRPEWIEHVGAHLVKKHHSDPHWDERSGRAVCRERVTLYGLEIVAGRRVSLAPVDPAAARELFIHHALVEDEAGVEAPFLAHNRALIEEVSDLEAKTRRTDIVADRNARFAFYDRRLGKQVCDAKSLERWRKDAERDNPRVLFMSREDLIAGDTSAITPELYPDRVEHAGASLGLEYKLAPGESDDGVSLRVPLTELGRVENERLGWLVPGLLREKIVELVRALPKDYRRAAGPAPQFAEAFLSETEFGSGSLIEALSGFLQKRIGAPVDAGVWREDALPEHLRMNLRVEDESGETLGEGREPDRIRAELRGHVRASLDDVEGFARSGIETWDFGDLPERVEAGRVTGYPVIADDGSSARLKLAENPDLAERTTRRGLTRLFALNVRRELRHQIDHLPGIDRLRLLFAPLGSGESLREAMIDHVARRVFVDDLPIVRTRDAFDARLDERWGGIGTAAHEAGDLAARILSAYHDAAGKLEAESPAEWRTSVSDIRGQLSYLMGEGGVFLCHTPRSWLACYPRYLSAVSRRIDKLRAGVAKDLELMAQVEPHWKRCRPALDASDPDADPPPHLERYRWMIEEQRVSLWAQDLKTVIPVSMKKLEQQRARAADEAATTSSAR